MKWPRSFESQFNNRPRHPPRLAAPRRRRAGTAWPGALMADEGLLRQPASAAALAGRPDDRRAPPTFPAKAKSVIWIFINGGPSHVDTWEYKPGLEKYDGQELKGLDPRDRLFQECRRPADEVSVQVHAARAVRENGLQHLSRTSGEHVDKMAFIHSGFTESNNHSPALFMMNCGLPRMGLPCVGSWVTYGLGSASRDLPALWSCPIRRAAACPREMPATGAGFPARRVPGDLSPAYAATRSPTLPARLHEPRRSSGRSSISSPPSIASTKPAPPPRRS